MQKIMVCHTSGPTGASIRSTIYGWFFEDGNEVVKEFGKRSDKHYQPNDIPVGLIPDGKFPLYPTVLHAIGDGWKLLSPPIKKNYSRIHEDENTEYHEWWLVKE